MNEEDCTRITAVVDPTLKRDLKVALAAKGEKGINITDWLKAKAQEEISAYRSAVRESLVEQ